MPQSESIHPALATFREAMHVGQRYAYFDHAAVAPLPEPARLAVLRWAEEATRSGDTVWPAWSRRVEECRTLAAQLIAAHPDEIALVPSTTAGITQVAEGFPWQAGDNVVTLDNEFPSNLYPWLQLGRRGVETRRVPTDDGRVSLDRLAAACDHRTRIVSLSWIGYSSGWRCELNAAAEMAHDRGALLFVDAIQGLGVFPLSVQDTPIDFLAADGHKWLLGPEGAGILYVRRRHLELLTPQIVGWHSVRHAHDFTRIELDFKPSAARFEGGTQNMVGFIGLAESLALLQRIGIASISQQVLHITDLACEQLLAAGAKLHTHRDREARSGIVSFTWPNVDPQAARQRLLERGVVASCRAGKLRISPHGYATHEDVERLIRELPAL